MKPIEKTSITDMVVANLKELLTSGELSVGEKLPTEKEICQQLDVSRSAVREALRVLQAMDFIKMKPGKGAFVAKTREDDHDSIVNWFVEHEPVLTDFMEVRSAIETLAIKLAVSRATDNEIEEIKEIHADFENTLKTNDYDRLSILDEAFHNCIAKFTYNNLLIAIYKKVSDVFRPYRTKSFAVKGNAEHALLPHKEIIDALEARDNKRVINAMSKHIQISLKDITEVVNNDKQS
jgi:GntR family transcriptional repressor for pyruvate dehydrogenase complex